MSYYPSLNPIPSDREVYTVSQLNREVHECLRVSFPLLWIEGEISNLARPASGHAYFSLKDPQAQIRCAMFRARNQRLDFTPEDGMHVLIQARISLYEPRGDYQLIVEQMQQAGDGALRRAFEQRKLRLSKEGLFDNQHKKPIPALPNRIGVITSATGAAIQDILRILQRRFPAIPVVLYPVPVQGEGAADRIAHAIQIAQRRAECDVLIVGRGGGSLEDLWAFNEEVLARAIYACDIPIISAVGHEVDVTIADFVADVRASTPSAAAELVSPDMHAWLDRTERLITRLSVQINHRLQTQAQSLDALSKRLTQQHPSQRLAQQQTRMLEIQRRLAYAIQVNLQRSHAQLERTQAQLLRYHPLPGILALRDRINKIHNRLQLSTRIRLERAQQRLVNSTRALEAVSPLATLGRGYAIIRRAANGELLRDVKQVQVGESIKAQLHQGSLICTVDKTSHD